MPTSIQVKAAPGIKVPMEDSPRKYITDAESVEVPESAYYLRRLKDGDLVPARDTAPTASEGVDIKAGKSSNKPKGE